MDGYEILFIYLAISILLLPCVLIFLVIKPILKLSKPLSHIAWPVDSQFIDQTPIGLQQLIANCDTKLRVRSFRKEKEEPVKCIVCLCNMKEGEETRELKCRHVFHRGCLDQWVEFGHVVCPLCRVPLLTAEAKARIIETVYTEVHDTRYGLESDVRNDWCFW